MFNIFLINQIEMNYDCFLSLFERTKRNQLDSLVVLCTVDVHSKVTGLYIKPVLYGTLKQDTPAWTPWGIH